MKLISYCLIVLGIMMSVAAKSQVEFKTSYYGKSDYLDGDHNKVGNSEGSAMVYQGAVQLPISMKMNERKQPTIWGVGIGGAYASLNNKNFTEDLVLDEIMNMQVGVMHVRPLNEKWSMMASVGVGIFAPSTRFSQISFDNIMGNLGVIFIKQIKPNLSIGGGLAVNNTFGYPMIFPSLYFDWTYESRFILKISMLDGGKFSVGYNVKKSLNLT